MEKKSLREAFKDFNLEVDKRWTCSTMPIPSMRVVHEGPAPKSVENLDVCKMGSMGEGSWKFQPPFTV